MLNLADRKSNSPWGSNYKEGLPSTAVNDTVEVNQVLRPTVNTGVIDVDTGQWEGIVTSDKTFLIDTEHLAVANGAAVLSPQTQPDRIDMTGYRDLIIAIKPSNGGNVGIIGVMGPNTNYFANLTPVNSGSTLKGVITPGNQLTNLLIETAESLTADVWNIYTLENIFSDQKLLQFKITNNSGAPSNIQFAYMRVV